MAAALTLKSIPKDVNDYILKLQYLKKVEKGVSQYSKELTIFQVIREHKELKEKLK